MAGERPEGALTAGDEERARKLRRSILLAHLVTLPLALGLAFALCGRDLGWSDSLVIARSPVLDRPHPSLAEYVVLWYTHLNGRLSQAAVASLVRLPFASSTRPEDFPFWVFAGLSFSCSLLTLVLVGASVARARRATSQGVLVALLVFGVWATNPVSFENVTYHHLAIFLAYLLPSYLAALWFWHTLELGHANPSRLQLAVHGLGYLFLSAYVEVVLLTAPFLGVLGWAVAQRMRPRPRSFWVRLLSAYAVLSAMAALVYWLSPGQRIRVAILGVGFPTMQATPLARVLRLVPTGFFGLDPHLAIPAYAVVLLGLTGIVVHSARARRADGTAAAAAVLFVAHAVAVSPALSVDLPARTAIYPALLLVTSLGLALLATLDPGCDPGRRPRATIAVVAGLVAVAAIGVAALQIRECAVVQKERTRFFGLRQSIYGYVLAVHDRSGASSFVLTNCNLAPDGGPLEPPWGLQAYFGWARSAQVRVFIDTNYDFGQRPSNLDYTRLSCRSRSTPLPN